MSIKLQNKEHTQARVLWEDALTRVGEGRPYAMDEERAEQLAGALSDIRTRDLVLLFAMNSQASTLDIPESEMEETMARVLNREPDHERVGRIVDFMAVLSVLIAQVPAMDAMSAYLMWASGEPVVAVVFAQSALERDPHYSLAQLVVHAVGAGLPAPWQ